MFKLNFNVQYNLLLYLSNGVDRVGLGHRSFFGSVIGLAMTRVELGFRLA